MKPQPTIEGANAMLLPDEPTTGLVTRPAAPMAQAPTPMVLLQMAMDQGADLEKLTKLMDLQERWEANEAHKAFVAALAAFKAHPPVLEKNKTVDYTSKSTGNRTTYKHATLDEVAIQIGEALAPHGLSFRWNVEQAGGRVKVTCILQHAMGHSETVTMDGPLDDSGQKNAIQQAGSTVTYLERYTLLAITGMAVKDQDNDGRGAPPLGLPEDAFQAHLAAIRAAADMTNLQAVFAKAWKAAGTDQPTKKALTQEYEKRKGELR